MFTFLQRRQSGGAHFHADFVANIVAADFLKCFAVILFSNNPKSSKQTFGGHVVCE